MFFNKGDSAMNWSSLWGGLFLVGDSIANLLKFKRLEICMFLVQFFYSQTQICASNMRGYNEV